MKSYLFSIRIHILIRAKLIHIHILYTYTSSKTFLICIPETHTSQASDNCVSVCTFAPGKQVN